MTRLGPFQFRVSRTMATISTSAPTRSVALLPSPPNVACESAAEATPPPPPPPPSSEEKSIALRPPAEDQDDGDHHDQQPAADQHHPGAVGRVGGLGRGRFGVGLGRVHGTEALEDSRGSTEQAAEEALIFVIHSSKVWRWRVTTP